MASFETRVTEIRADPRGGFSVMLKPHFLERNVAYQKVWLEPHFEKHCASIAEDSIEFVLRTPRLFSWKISTLRGTRSTPAAPNHRRNCETRACCNLQSQRLLWLSHAV